MRATRFILTALSILAASSALAGSQQSIDGLADKIVKVAKFRVESNYKNIASGGYSVRQDLTIDDLDGSFVNSVSSASGVPIVSLYGCMSSSMIGFYYSQAFSDSLPDDASSAAIKKFFASSVVDKDVFGNCSPQVLGAAKSTRMSLVSSLRGRSVNVVNAYKELISADVALDDRKKLLSSGKAQPKNFDDAMATFGFDNSGASGDVLLNPNSAKKGTKVFLLGTAYESSPGVAYFEVRLRPGTYYYKTILSGVNYPQIASGQFLQVIGTLTGVEECKTRGGDSRFMPVVFVEYYKGRD